MTKYTGHLRPVGEPLQLLQDWKTISRDRWTLHGPIGVVPDNRLMIMAQVLVRISPEDQEEYIVGRVMPPAGSVFTAPQLVVCPEKDSKELLRGDNISALRRAGKLAVSRPGHRALPLVSQAYLEGFCPADTAHTVTGTGIDKEGRVVIFNHMPVGIDVQANWSSAVNGVTGASSETLATVHDIARNA